MGKLFAFLARTAGVLSIAAAAAFCMPGSAHAGQQRPCSAPAVFEGAAVNALVLPYRYDGSGGSPELEQASRQIAALVHLEVLFSMVKYGSIGATELKADRYARCNDVDDIIDRVVRRGRSGTLRPGQTLVAVWGRLFEQGDQLYVQSYLRFLRQGDAGPVNETIAVPLANQGIRLDLVAALPSQSIAFLPRRIGKADLARVNGEFRRSMVVRPSPDLNVPGQSIDFAPDLTFSYFVTRAQGDWMWIQPHRRGPAGWVRARTGDAPEQWSLQRWLPELAYVEAVAGFMRLRAAIGVGDSTMRSRIIAAIDTALQRFERVVSADQAPTAYGLAHAIQGFVAWDREPDGPRRARAAALFADARARMPEYAAARNLAAVTQPLRTNGGFDAKSAALMDRELMSALALDPTDRVVLDNVERLYRMYASRPEWSPFKPDEVRQRMAVIQAARATAPMTQ